MERRADAMGCDHTTREFAFDVTIPTVPSACGVSSNHFLIHFLLMLILHCFVFHATFCISASDK
jgi:hypothetical protein